MLGNNHIPIPSIWFHPLKDRCAPTPLLKHFALFLARMYNFLVFPALEITCLVGLVETVVDGNFVGTGCGKEGKDVGYSIGGFDGFFEEAVELSFWVDEVVVRVYE